jgi:hypothetical protein
MHKTAKLDDVLVMSRQLPRADRLRLISLLSEDLRSEMEASGPLVDMLLLAGLGAELWQTVDVDAYLEQERTDWDA